MFSAQGRVPRLVPASPESAQAQRRRAWIGSVADLIARRAELHKRHGGDPCECCTSARQAFATEPVAIDPDVAAIAARVLGDDWLERQRVTGRPLPPLVVFRGVARAQGLGERALPPQEQIASSLGVAVGGHAATMPTASLGRDVRRGV
jgi:hypothetical protein